MLSGRPVFTVTRLPASHRQAVHHIREIEHVEREGGAEVVDALRRPRSRGIRVDQVRGRRQQLGESLADTRKPPTPNRIPNVTLNDDRRVDAAIEHRAIMGDENARRPEHPPDAPRGDDDRGRGASDNLPWRGLGCADAGDSRSVRCCH